MRVGLLAHPLAVPPGLAGAVVDAEGVREKKKRSLSSVLIVYLNLVLWLFPDQGMGQCLRELAAGLPQVVRESARWRNVTSSSISAVRERVGPGVMREIFEHLAGLCGSPCSSSTAPATSSSSGGRPGGLSRRCGSTPGMLPGPVRRRHR